MRIMIYVADHMRSTPAILGTFAVEELNQSAKKRYKVNATPSVSRIPE